MADLKGFNNDEQGRSAAANIAADSAHHVSPPIQTETETDTLGLKNPAFGTVVVLLLLLF